jgi:hypothetical protein
MHGPYRKHRSSVALPIVACAAIGSGRAENTAFQPIHWRMLEICCLATGVVYSNYLASGLHATVVSLSPCLQVLQYCLKIGQNCFISHLFQLLTPQLFHHWMVHNVYR